jgi:hypothetical protein
VEKLINQVSDDCCGRLENAARFEVEAFGLAFAP